MVSLAEFFVEGCDHAIMRITKAWDLAAWRDAHN